MAAVIGAERGRTGKPPVRRKATGVFLEGSPSGEEDGQETVRYLFPVFRERAWRGRSMRKRAQGPVHGNVLAGSGRVPAAAGEGAYGRLRALPCGE